MAKEVALRKFCLMKTKIWGKAKEMQQCRIAEIINEFEIIRLSKVALESHTKKQGNNNLQLLKGEN